MPLSPPKLSSGKSRPLSSRSSHPSLTHPSPTSESPLPSSTSGKLKGASKDKQSGASRSLAKANSQSDASGQLSGSQGSGRVPNSTGTCTQIRNVLCTCVRVLAYERTLLLSTHIHVERIISSYLYMYMYMYMYSKEIL